MPFDYDYSHRLEGQPWYSDEPEDGSQWIILIGSPVSGFRALGTFSSYKNAVETVLTYGLVGNCWYMRVEDVRDWNDIKEPFK